ncbi:hypothetical protein IAU60_002018 [Kwoniella sp. DSM 27419]
MESRRAVTLPPLGMPILSGLPPVTESSNCRQCGKDFNPLWRRKKVCGHCGYEYCSTCMSDGQALMPRKPGQPSSSLNRESGPAAFFADLKEGLGIDDKVHTGGSGYEVESVCLYCLGMLQVTAASLVQLRSLPIKRLKEYLAAYNIPCIGPKEKEDFVQAVLRARDPTTGCLSQEAESYFRRKSVPKHNQPSSSSSSSPASTSSTPRPRPPPPTQARPSSTNGHRPSTAARPPAPSYPATPHAPVPARPPPATAARPPPPRSAPAPAATKPTPVPVRQPSPPVPTILSLVSLPKSYLSSLSIGTLKAILYENHVRVDFKQVLEKDQLIDRVNELVIDERKRLERQRIEEERMASGDDAPVAGRVSTEEGPVDGASGGETQVKVKVPTGPMPEVERGLCVVCQDEEATLAVVDCGHLCMCAHCSDLIMATSQECPLCRTRIVTPQRLIRIYRT